MKLEGVIYCGEKFVSKNVSNIGIDNSMNMAIIITTYR